MPRHRILLIDDDPSSRSLLTSFLRRDYVVFVACDGCEGYSRAVEQPPDLVVMELRMQGWDGMRTLKLLRDHSELGHIPVVIVSCDASHETVTAAVAAGATDYVLKLGLNREAFVQRIQKLLNRTEGKTKQRTPVVESAEKSPSPHLNGATQDHAALQSLMDNWE